MAHADTFQTLSRECRLPPDAMRQLTTHGFVVIPGPYVRGGIAQVQAAYDTAVATADAADMRISSSTRVTDFVNRSAEFDGLYVHPPLLAACCLVIGRPFKLSNTCARTLEPGAPAQKLHVDVKHEADGWPLVGYIWMIDSFSAANGATRFVSGSHLRHHGPEGCSSEDAIDSDEKTLACGPAGSLIVFNASVWHGHAANQSAHRRRSVQGHFVARDATAAINYRSRMRPDTESRIQDVARYLLDLPDAV
jgi:ectoine hydroxylase-related dioxygenase (phytanoyl-CoA dioxygenase family)